MQILYYSPGSCSIAPHIVLEEVGIPFEARRINLADNEHRTSEYSAINPRQRVPALIVDGEVVTEVPALLVYIAGLRPEAGLLPPPGTIELARCLEWTAFLSSSVHIAVAQCRRPERFVPAGFKNEAAFIEQGRLNALLLYQEIEDRLAEPWVIGEQYSIADAYLFPFYLWSWRIGLDMEADSPRCAAWEARMRARPAVTRALAREGLEVS